MAYCESVNENTRSTLTLLRWCNRHSSLRRPWQSRAVHDQISDLSFNRFTAGTLLVELWVLSSVLLWDRNSRRLTTSTTALNFNPLTVAEWMTESPLNHDRAACILVRCPRVPVRMRHVQYRFFYCYVYRSISTGFSNEGRIWSDFQTGVCQSHHRPQGVNRPFTHHLLFRSNSIMHQTRWTISQGWMEDRHFCLSSDTRLFTVWVTLTSSFLADRLLSTNLWLRRLAQICDCNRIL